MLNPRIVMDERERGSIREAFTKLPCDLQLETLPTADFVISATCGIERKRGDDLVASLCDSRFFSQLYALKAIYPYPILILEDPFRMFSREGVYEASLYGALIYAVYKMGIALIPTINAQETALIIWSLAKRTQAMETFHYIPKVVTKPIGRPDQLFFLEGLLDCGQTRADQLLDLYQTPAKILDAIEHGTLTNHESMKIKGIGARFLRKNQKLLSTTFLDAQQMVKE